MEPGRCALFLAIVSIATCVAFPTDCSTADCRLQVAQNFAPYLRFDQDEIDPNKCFLSDAQPYYNARKAGNHSRICNEDYATIENGDVPVYFAYEDCDESTTVIMYWFFYGFQDECMAGGIGSHDADWERVAVKITDGTLVHVQYYQHSGCYTREIGNYEIYESTHMVAYIGKNSHGSYHDGGGTGTCLYFSDYRNPGDRDLHMKTWSNLVELRTDADAPEWMTYQDTEYWDGLPGPLARGVQLCSLPGCAGDNPIVGGVCTGECGCAKSDIGDSPF